MAQSNTFGVESIFRSLNELKHEKACLAQKLQEQATLRRRLEHGMEQVNLKYNQLQEKHRRSSETLAIAQQKVDEVLKSIQIIEGKISSNRQGRGCIQRAIEEEKTLHKEYLAEFESEMSSIASSLFAARDSYKDEALINEIATIEVKCKALDDQKEELLKKKKSLTLKLNKLLAEEESYQADYGMKDTMKAIACALERDLQEMRCYLQRLKAEHQSIHDALKNAQASASRHDWMAQLPSMDHTTTTTTTTTDKEDYLIRI